MKILGSHPRMGRPIDDLPEQYREWPIGFGDSIEIHFHDFVSDSTVTINRITGEYTEEYDGHVYRRGTWFMTASV